MEIINKNPIFNLKIKSLKDLGLSPKYVVRRKDEENKHLYTIDNFETSYVGVTSVLDVLNKPFLIPWASKMCANRIDEILNRFKLRLMPRLFKKGIYEITPTQVFDIFMRLTRPQLLTRLTDYGKKQHRRIADTAADIGTRAHKAIDDIINGRPVTITEDIRLPVEGFLYWLKITNLIIVAGDTKVASAEEEFGGSLDGMVIDQNNALQVLDFKTSNQFADSYAFQMGAYSKAFTETYGLPTLPEGFILRMDKFKPKIEIRKVTFINEAWKTFQSLLWVYQLMKINYYDKTQTWKFNASKPTRDERPKDKGPKEKTTV